MVLQGDALGLRAFTDELADHLAPGLSNRTRDGRWLTILSWCLQRSQFPWTRVGTGQVRTARDRHQRYAWIRPLELLWIARTLELSKGDGTIRDLLGRRRVSDWLETGRRKPRFAMSPEQFENYRRIGVYAGYRVLFRHVEGLTRDGDGWTPGPKAMRLASWLEENLGIARAGDLHDLGPLKWASWDSKEDNFWRKRGWPYWSKGRGDRTLPRPRDEAARLPEAELLADALFPKTDDTGAKRRRGVAVFASRSTARDHTGLLVDLARALKKEQDGEVISWIPEFSDLADAGMSVMDEVLGCLGRMEDQDVSISELAANLSVTSALAELRRASLAWRRRSATPGSEHAVPAQELAQAGAVMSRSERLKRVLLHHRARGGGVKWFSLNEASVRRAGSFGTFPSSRYRFRLWPLCRLAAQAGVARWPASLSVEGGDDEDSGEDAV